MEIVGIGPSLVDVCARLKEDDFQLCLSEFEMEPGEWKRLESEEELSRLTEIITGNPVMGSDFLYKPSMTTTVAVGSSVLGMLASLEPAHRNRSNYASSIATTTDGCVQDLSDFFIDEVQCMGVTPIAQKAVGTNPLGFVIGSDSNPEKILVNYPGVTTELDAELAVEAPGSIVLVDAYELLHGRIAETLDTVIRENRNLISLSLGNHTILTGDLVSRIHEYIESGNIHILCGNQKEYSALYPQYAETTDYHDFTELPIAKYVPYTLTTFGADGLIFGWDNSFFHQQAAQIDQKDIVNTSGAGDTATGAFISGVIGNAPHEDSMRRAACLATKVLQVPSSLYVAHS